MDNIYDQKGAGGMPVYYGARYLRGMGIGSMFKSKNTCCSYAERCS